MPILLISQFNGGISSGDKIGLAGSFRFTKGVDIHSNPDVLKVSPATSKDSALVVTDLPVFASTNTVNSNIYFLGDTGCLYKKESATYTKIGTYTSGQGMGFFGGTNQIFFVAGNVEYRLDPASDAITTGRTLISTDYHPVEAFLDKVFIGNGRQLISTDASAIDYDSTTVGGGLSLEYGYKIRCLKNIGDWLFIGCSSDNSSTAKYYLWDGVSEDFNYSKTLKGEDGINAVEVSDDGTVLISVGKKGHLYQLTGIDTMLLNVKSFPRIENDKTIYSFPQCMANYQGKVLIGLSDGTSVTAERGVYSWASHSYQYAKTLNLDYTMATGNTTGTTVQIGCLLAANTTDLYIGRRDGSNYAIDIVTGVGTQATASVESLIHDNGRPFIRKFYTLFKVNLAKELASGEVITIYYKKDRGSWVSIGTLDFSVDGAILEKTFKPASKIKARELEIKVEFANASTTSPEIDAISIEYDEENLV